MDNKKRNDLQTMISWLNQPVEHLTTRTQRIHFYIIALVLVAVSVPFLHLMDDSLSPVEVVSHVLNVVFSTTIAILLFEFILWLCLKVGIRKVRLSTGLFWLLFFGVFTLSFIVMYMTHSFFPITSDIWHKHIEPDLLASPWKILPMALLIGYILIQLIRRYHVTQELADLKKTHEQLQTERDRIVPSDNDTRTSQPINTPRFVLPYKGGCLYLNPALIIRVESNENYCHVLVAPDNSQSEHSYMARITLTEVIKQLPEKLFLQVHRSHLINFTYVSNLERQGRNYRLQLTNGDHIPVSRSRIENIRERGSQLGAQFIGHPQ